MVFYLSGFFEVDGFQMIEWNRAVHKTGLE
jgi:hypothetical protein